MGGVVMIGAYNLRPVQLSIEQALDCTKLAKKYITTHLDKLSTVFPYQSIGARQLRLVDALGEKKLQRRAKLEEVVQVARMQLRRARAVIFVLFVHPCTLVGFFLSSGIVVLEYQVLLQKES